MVWGNRDQTRVPRCDEVPGPPKAVPDGGTDTKIESIDRSREYSRRLQELSRVARQLKDDPDSVPDSAAARVVGEFLAHPRVGGAYASGLARAGKVIVTAELSPSHVHNFSIEREQKSELIKWLLRHGHTADPAALSEEAFQFALHRSEWTDLVRSSVVRHGASGVTDSQLRHLAFGVEGTERAGTFVSELSQRDEGQARELLSAHFEATVDRQTPIPLLDAAADLGLDDVYRQRLAASLSRWRPDKDDIDTLAALVDRGRAASQHDRVLLAVSRWLRKADWDTVPADRRNLVAAAIEAMLERDGPGSREAVITYRKHIYPAESLYGISPAIYDAADAAGDPEVADDVVRVFNLGDPDQASLDEIVLAAHAAERDEQWDEAFNLWKQALSESDDSQLYRYAIDNRLETLRLESAEALAASRCL